MKRILFALSIVVVGVGSSAVVASAGFGEDAPATVGYTVLVEATGPDAATDSTSSEEPAPTPPGPEVVDGLEVGPLQGLCAGRLATVDLTSGAVVPLPEPSSLEACAGDLAFAPDGTLYGLVQGIDAFEVFPELVRFDTATGRATVVGRIGDFSAQAGFGLPVPTGGLTFDAAGHLFVEVLESVVIPSSDPECVGDDIVAFCLYRVDDATQPGAATLVGASRAGPSISFLVSGMSADCTAAYTSVLDAMDAPATDALATLDTQSAAVGEIGEPRADRFIVGQAFDRAGELWGLEAVEDASLSPVGYELVTLDPAGGTPVDTPVATLDVAPPEVFVNGLAIEPLDCTPEPEPLVLTPTFTG